MEENERRKRKGRPQSKEKGELKKLFENAIYRTEKDFEKGWTTRDLSKHLWGDDSLEHLLKVRLLVHDLKREFRERNPEKGPRMLLASINRKREYRYLLVECFNGFNEVFNAGLDIMHWSSKALKSQREVVNEKLPFKERQQLANLIKKRARQIEDILTEYPGLEEGEEK